MCKNPQCNCMRQFLHNPIFSTTTYCIRVHSISESPTQAVPLSHSPNQSPFIFSNVTSQKKLLITSTSPSLRMRYQRKYLPLLPSVISLYSSQRRFLLFQDSGFVEYDNSRTLQYSTDVFPHMLRLCALAFHHIVKVMSNLQVMCTFF